MACSRRILTLLRPLFPASTAHTRYLWHGRGAYRPIDNVEVPEVQDVAKFAITEHNKHRGVNLQFERVLEGEKQVVAGINYKLLLAASSDRKPGKYEAVVYDRPWENIRRLTSFRFIELFGGELYSVLPDYSPQPPQSFPQKGFTDLLGQMSYLFNEVHQTIEPLQQLMAYLREFIKGSGDDEDTDHGEVINDRSSSQMSNGDDGEVIKDHSSSQMSSTGDDGEVIKDHSSSQMSSTGDDEDPNHGEVIEDRSQMSSRDDEDTDFDEVINHGHSSYEMSSEDDEDTDDD